jgi:hypothetical protein
MKNKPTKYMISLMDKMKDEKLSPKTIDLYMSKMMSLNAKGEAFANLSFLKNEDVIDKKIDEVTNLNTKRSLITSIVSTLNYSGLSKSRGYKNADLHYKKLLDGVVEEIRGDSNGGKKSNRQITNWIEWSEVLDIVKDYAEKSKGYTSGVGWRSR